MNTEQSTNARKSKSPTRGTPVPSILRQAESRKKSQDKLCRDNAAAALRLVSPSMIFADPYVAIGMFKDFMKKELGPEQIETFRAAGIAFMITLGIADDSDIAEHDNSAKREVIVSLPLSHLSSLEKFYALGLRRTKTSKTRQFFELRGISDLAATKDLAAKFGGALTVVERPLAAVQERALGQENLRNGASGTQPSPLDEAETALVIKNAEIEIAEQTPRGIPETIEHLPAENVGNGPANEPSDFAGWSEPPAEHATQKKLTPVEPGMSDRHRSLLNSVRLPRMPIIPKPLLIAGHSSEAHRKSNMGDGDPSLPVPRPR